MKRILLTAALLVSAPTIGHGYGEPEEDLIQTDRRLCPPCANTYIDWERFRNFAIHVFAEDRSLLDFFRWRTYKVIGLYVPEWQDPGTNFAYVRLKRTVGTSPDEFDSFEWLLQLPNGTQRSGKVVLFEGKLPPVKPLYLPYPPGAEPGSGGGVPGPYQSDLCGCKHVC